MSDKIYIHVAPGINDAWSVSKTGAMRALRNFKTKSEAIKFAKQIHKKTNEDLVIHTSEGWVEKIYDSNGQLTN